MVLLVELINLVLVCNVSVLKLVEPILFSACMVLLNALDLLSEGLVLGDELFLVSPVLISILMHLDRSLGDVHLQLAPLVLRITQQVLMHMYVMLEVIHHLR
jgi:hypothetical protein